MKKFICLTLTLMLAVLVLFAFTACSNNKYDIVLDLNGGTLVNEKANTVFRNINVLNANKIPAVQREGYNLTGWALVAGTHVSELVTFPYSVPITEGEIAYGKEYTLRAQWELKEGWIEAEFDTDGATVNLPTVALEIATLDLTPYTQQLEGKKAGYKFVGWYLDETVDKFPVNAELNESLLEDSTTFYAKWEQVLTTITLSYYEGYEGVTELKGNYAATVTAPVTPIRDGYYFVGWYKDAEFETAYTFSTFPAKSLTVYAKWLSHSDDYTAGLEFQLNGDGYTVISADLDSSDTILVIPSQHEGKPVNAIGEKAFENCDKITAVYIPVSVTSIGKGAFVGCSAIKEMTLPFVGGSRSATGEARLFGYIFGDEEYDGSVSVNQYKDTATLVAYYIPSALTVLRVTDTTALAEGAFYAVSTIKTVDFADKLVNIGENAFAHCTALTGIFGTNSVTTIAKRAFYSCQALTAVSFANDSITVIPQEAFWGCLKLTSFVLPDSVTVIGQDAFRHCTTLAEFLVTKYTQEESEVGGEMQTVYTTKSKVTVIGNGAFYNCTKLLTLNVGYMLDLTSIGDNAFAKCTSLNTVAFELLTKLSTIGEKAFFGCSVLVGKDVIVVDAEKKINNLGLYFPSSLTSIGKSAFENCAKITTVKFAPNGTLAVINDRTFYGCTSLSSVVWSGLTATAIEVKKEAFYNTGFVNLNLPNNLAIVGESAFANCLKLKTLLFNQASTLSSVATKAFANNTTLEKVVLPASLTAMGEKVFYGCTKLLDATTPLVNSFASSMPATWNAEWDVVRDAEPDEKLSIAWGYTIPEEG